MSKFLKLLNAVNHDQERNQEERALLEKVMLAKPRSIADRNREAALKKKEAAEMTASSNPDSNNANIVTTEGQLDNTLVTSKEQVNSNIVTTQGRHRGTTMAPSGQGSNRTVTVTGQLLSETLITDPNCIELTEIQMRVYSWFLNNGMAGYFNKAKLSKDTDIIHNTVRKVIIKLRDSGLIFFGKYNDGTRLIPYKINNEKTAINGVVTGYGQDSNNNRTGSSPIIVSSKFLNKTNLLSTALKENPDLAYWQNKLKPQKIEAWMDELKISEEDMIESLCHCAFEMIQRNETDKKGQEIKNVLDWFYSIMKKYRFYDKPTGYKSFEEIAIERAEQRLKEKQERINRINEIKKAEREADIDLLFSEMMQKPESEEYKKCYDALNEIAKRKNSGTIFTSVMRSKFIEFFFPEDLPN